MSDFDLAWIAHFCKFPIKAVYDIGSYDGGDAIRFKQFLPSAQVLAIEACPLNYSKVKCNCDRAGVIPIHAAVTNVNGIIDFHSSSGVSDGSGSIYAPIPFLNLKYASIEFGLNFKVPAIRLDALYNTFSPPDIIHMDVQSAELSVILGMGSVRPKLIFAEVSAFSEYLCGASREIFETVLFSYGYKQALVVKHDCLYIHSE